MTKQNAVALVEADAVVVSMMRASSALAQAQTIQQTKKILDVAHAAEIYAKRQHLGEEAMGIAASIKVEALRKLGEMLQVAPRATAFLGGTKKVPTRNDAPTLEELGLTKKESAVAQKLAALPEKEFEQVRDGHMSIAKAIAAVESAKPLAPAKEEPPDTSEHFGPDADELEAQAKADAADAVWLQKLLDSDDKLAAAHAEIKRLNAVIATLEVVRDGYMNGRNEAIKMVKRLQTRLDKMERAAA